jgi:signal transduction histidine kinase
MRVQYKIVIPFTALFIVATLATALVSISLMARNLDARVTTQLDQASRMVSRADFALNSSILQNLKAVIGADVVTFKRDGTVLATTVKTSENTETIPAVLSPQGFPAKLETGEQFELREVNINGRPHKIGYRLLSSPPDTIVAVIADTSDIAATQRAIATRVLLLAALIVVLMSVISHMIARSVTAPVLDLVAFTKTVAAGERNQRANVRSGDEIGVLAGAFNEMMDQLRRSEEKLLQSEKLAVTGLLAARVAHEVRNPLSAIKMQAQLLRSKLKTNAADQQLVVSILQEIERVEWVVRGMLDLASTQELQLEREHVADVVDEVLDLTAAQLRHRKIIVKKAYDAAAPAVMLDRNRLKIAFLNLIMNASEAMTNGGTLEISVGKKDDSLVIEIQDDGVGIAPSVRDRLFDPFVTTKREGVGLGLVNTKNIIERHGGTIDLLPRDGSGARAVIRLGLQQAHG